MAAGRQASIAKAVISAVCRAYRNSDLRADDKTIIASLDAVFAEAKQREQQLEDALIACFDAAIPQASPWTGTQQEKAIYATTMLPEHLRGLNRLLDRRTVMAVNGDNDTKRLNKLEAMCNNGQGAVTLDATKGPYPNLRAALDAIAVKDPVGTGRKK